MEASHAYSRGGDLTCDVFQIKSPVLPASEIIVFFVAALMS